MMFLDRRAMLQESALGFGSLALASMLREEALASGHSNHGLPRPHHAAGAKSIIFLFMSGGPGQTDTFDPKPMLTKLDGERVPESIAATVPNIPRAGVGSKLFGSPFSFKPYGDSGIPVSNLFPQTAEFVDEL